MQSAFGMDVQTYCQLKAPFRSGENLRDHMTEIELALVTLAETVAVNLHRARESRGLDQLAADAKDAGDVVAITRREIEARSGKPAPKSAA